MPAEVVFTQVSLMDEHGYILPRSGPSTIRWLIRKARAVIVEVNPTRPSLGNCHPHPPKSLRWSRTTSWCSKSACRPSDRCRNIGGAVADMIDDGLTLQIGYGGIPDAGGDAAYPQARSGYPH